MEKNNIKKYVFNEVEDVEKLDSEKLKQYAYYLQDKLVEAKADVTAYKNVWYNDAGKLRAIKEDIDMLKKLFNLITKQW